MLAPHGPGAAMSFACKCEGRSAWSASIMEAYVTMNWGSKLSFAMTPYKISKSHFRPR